MRAWYSRICALLLALILMPGVFELVENAVHLAGKGHLAHATPDGDRHESAGDEHGCTPIFHACGCHASLAFVAAPSPPAAHLRDAGFACRPAGELLIAAIWPSIDRPPQV